VLDTCKRVPCVSFLAGFLPRRYVILRHRIPLRSLVKMLSYESVETKLHSSMDLISGVTGRFANKPVRQQPVRWQHISLTNRQINALSTLLRFCHLVSESRVNVSKMSRHRNGLSAKRPWGISGCLQPFRYHSSRADSFLRLKLATDHL